MDHEYKPVNQNTDPRYNQEPGIIVVPGSPYAQEMERFEQFPSKYGSNPGNPHRFRPFPKMLYRAESVNGTPLCMAAPPDPVNFSNPQEFERAEMKARKFTEQCQIIVKDESEMQKAFENGWRLTPQEAVEYLKNRGREVATETAHREYDDRNMSELAKREIAAAKAEVGGAHLPEIKEKRRGRPKGSKNKPKE